MEFASSSPYGLASVWSQGDWVIRSVAVILLLMSIGSWWVILTRAWRLAKLHGAARAATAFWHARSFEEGLQVLQAPGTPSPALNPFHHLAVEGRAAADHHVSHREELHGQMSLAEWVSDALRAAVDDGAERLRSGLSVLASVGSTAPFVGLFGTVWGIYHALIGIGASGRVGIDQVAAPVGEALIMTAFGLVVAIPAVLGYNGLNRANRAVVGKLRRFARQLQSYLLTGRPVAAGGAASLPDPRPCAADRPARAPLGGSANPLAAEG